MKYVPIAPAIVCDGMYCVCVCAVGSNGSDFMFLLKGHEDLRQDERVMQLFGLVNTLLTNDPETFKRHLRLAANQYIH